MTILGSIWIIAISVWTVCAGMFVALLPFGLLWLCAFLYSERKNKSTFARVEQARKEFVERSRKEWLERRQAPDDDRL